MNKTDITIAQQLLSTSHSIVVVSHRNPDGDAVGSALGLGLLLKKLNSNVQIILPNDFPEFLAWMPESQNILIFENEVAKATEVLQQADLVFTLDFNAFHRTGDLMGHVLSELSANFIMIDHHERPDDYAQYMYSDISFSSTCEMVYHFIAQLGYQHLIDKDIASCLYTGIVTDSGSFKYSSTTSTTHRVVASLIDIGIENAKIHNLLFDNNSYNRLKLLGRALEKMTVLPEYKTAYIILSQADLNEFNFQKGDTEGIVNYPLTIKGIDFSVIFIENTAEGIIKMSLRSQGDFDVNLFARNYFNGGGHKNASGGRSDKSLSESVGYFLSVIKEDNPSKL